VTCGDATCDPTEDCTSCPIDCGLCVTCGDATCDPSEDCTTCPADCGLCIACGDGRCENLLAPIRQAVIADEMKVTAGEKEFRTLTFVGAADETDLTRGGKWAPDFPSLDALILRLGDGAQATNISLSN